VTRAAAVFKRARGLGAAAIGRPKSVWADAHGLELEFEFKFKFKFKEELKRAWAAAQRLKN